VRIALISFEYPPETLGGIGTYARHAAAMLAKRGHDVTVFSGTAGNSPSAENRQGIFVRRLPCASRQDFHRAAALDLAEEHKRMPFDVAEVPDLYAEGRGLRSRLAGLPMLLRAHTPLYIPSEIDFLALPAPARCLSGLHRLFSGLGHGEPPRRAWREALARVSFARSYEPERDPERQVAWESDLVASPSRRLARRLVRDWGLPPEKVRILPYPHVPDPELLALPAPTAIRTLGYHGSIRYFKGVHTLLAAMPRILSRHPGIRLEIAGASGGSPVPNISWSALRRNRMLEWKDTLDWLRPKLAAFGDRVVVRGFVPPARLAEHLSRVDLCAFPSLFDNFPSACLEAMSAARAIVATRSGGMEEMLAGGEAGLLVAPGDDRALAAAICRLIEDPGLAGRLAAEARRRLLAEYNFDRIGPLHESIYAEAISRRKGGIR
jgi:glycosyltransferase involved in cell wall biosynthesis